jgi:hypothetical protein
MTALPVLETKAAPLVFRRWTRYMPMVRGVWNIPVPPPDAGAVTPRSFSRRCVGWAPAGYRLGYGGGYFDRTLAALRPRPFVIGVGLQAARLETIYPQTHDIPMDVIVTEDGVQITRATGLMTVAHRDEATRRRQDGPEACRSRRGRRSPSARRALRRDEDERHRPHRELRGGSPRCAGGSEVSSHKVAQGEITLHCIEGHAQLGLSGGPIDLREGRLGLPCRRRAAFGEGDRGRVAASDHPLRRQPQRPRGSLTGSRRDADGRRRGRWAAPRDPGPPPWRGARPLQLPAPDDHMTHAREAVGPG